MRRKLRYFEDEEGAPAPVGIQIRRRIRFSEVDALGIAWHGRYPVFFEEAQTGALRPGMRENLIILSADPLQIPPEKSADIRVEETIADGITLFRR